MNIFYTSKFKREYKKLTLEIKKKAETREALFRKEPFASILKTHSLKGVLEGFWSFSVDFSYRIIFEFNDDQTIVIFHSVGTHDIYK